MTNTTETEAVSSRTDDPSLSEYETGYETGQDELSQST